MCTGLYTHPHPLTRTHRLLPIQWQARIVDVDGMARKEVAVRLANPLLVLRQSGVEKGLRVQRFAF